jgi:hypothetical protein
MRIGDRKKLREWSLIKQLDALLGVVPDGEVDEGGERPDFIIRKVRAFGIEVTEYHSDFREMARHSEQEAIVAEARAEHRRRFRVPLMVRVYWNSFDPVRGKERRKLVASLVETVAAHAPPAGHRRVLDRDVDDGIPLPVHIDRLDIHRFDQDPDIDWISVRYAMVPELDAGRITDIIRRKSALVGGFRVVDELWLVIGVGGRSVSSWGLMSQATCQAEYPSAFDRIFVVSYAPRVASELRTVPFR